MKLKQSNLKKQANSYNRKKFRKTVIGIIRNTLNEIKKDAKSGKYIWDSGIIYRFDNGFENKYAAFMWIVRYSGLDAKIIYIKYKYYIRLTVNWR